jgi:hypothetical protein
MQADGVVGEITIEGDTGGDIPLLCVETADQMHCYFRGADGRSYEQVFPNIRLDAFLDPLADV